MTKVRKEILKIADWMEEQVRQNPYSTVGVNLNCHDGRVSRVEYSLTVKVQTPVEKK